MLLADWGQLIMLKQLLQINLGEPGLPVLASRQICGKSIVEL